MVDDIKKIARKRAKRFTERTVVNNELESYINHDWLVVKQYKSKTRIKTEKAHDIGFVDKVWCLLSKLEFDYINKNTKIYLPTPGKDSNPEFDVIVADEETVLIIKCKSSKKLVEQNLEDEINEIISKRHESSNFIRQFFNNRELKIKYILATNEILLNEQNSKKLNDNDIIHLNQDDISYFEQLASHLGVATKYQFLCKIFKNQTIQGLNNKIPAIQGKMGSYKYYSFLIEPETLLKFSYILHRTGNNNPNDVTYQRMVSKSRLKEIKDFLNNGGYFPNSVIINIDSEKVSFFKASGEHDSNVAQHGILHLPQKYQSAFVIDGQHRLYGYANTEWKTKNSIPVVAFTSLPTEKQVEMFVDINYKQKSVAKNLLTTIMADLKWNSPIIGDAIFALHSRLIQRLGESEESPLYRRVIIGENKRTIDTCITLDYLVRSGFNKSLLFAQTQRSKLKNPGYFWVANSVGADYNEMLNKGYEYFRLIFSHISKEANEQWLLGANGLISMNVGITAVIRVCDCVLRHLVESEFIHPQSLSAKELALKTIVYIDPIILKIRQFDTLKLREYRKNSNAAGFENVVREFQKATHESIRTFNPLGLEKWITDNSGKWNTESKELVDKIQCSIRDHVYSILKLEYADRWWEDGVHKEIQKKAMEMRIDQGNIEPVQNYIFLLDYCKIINSKWSLFGEVYSDPNKDVYNNPKLGKSRKEKATYWFKKLNDIRTKVSHPERAKVTEEEYKFLINLQEWLMPKISTLIS